MYDYNQEVKPFNYVTFNYKCNVKEKLIQQYSEEFIPSPFLRAVASYLTKEIAIFSYQLHFFFSIFIYKIIEI